VRFVSVRIDGKATPGVMDGEEIVLIGDLFDDLTALIEEGQHGLDRAAKAMQETGRDRRSLGGADLGPPDQHVQARYSVYGMELLGPFR
jgi:hypothetical protein